MADHVRRNTQSCQGSIDHPHRRHADRGRPLAAYYRFSPDRRGERPRDHLAGFRGVIQADAFSGYEALTRPASAKDRVGRGPPLIHAACWAHARRKFYDVFESTKSPIAEDALERIGELYRIEAEITGQPAETRLAARQNRAVAILDALRDWLVAQRRRLSSKERPRQGDPVCAQPLGSADPLCW